MSTIHAAETNPRPRVRNRTEMNDISSPPQPYDLLQELNGDIRPFHEIFPSLLSIVKNIPVHIKITFSLMRDDSLKTRQLYLMGYTKRFEDLERSIQPHLAVIESLSTLTRSYYKICVDELTTWIATEQRVRTAMRRLTYLWLQKKYGKRFLNDDDPWTLAPPGKPIRIFDMKSRGVYQFEAHSIKKHMELALGYSEWMFPKPSTPKNPCTNIELSDGQLTTILKGLRSHGYGSWMIEAFSASRWDIKLFGIDNTVQLKLFGFEQLIKSQSPEMIELLEDFVEFQHEANIPTKEHILTALLWATSHKLNEPYMKQWISLFHEYHKIKIRYNVSDKSRHMNAIYVKSMQLFDNREVLYKYEKERM
jgi:hypothetical protein